MNQWLFPLLALALAFSARGAAQQEEEEGKKHILLPPPRTKGSTSVEEALLRRRSVREYAKSPISLADISQLLWSAQGVTDPVLGRRTAPSAGALYPLELYLVAGDVTGLERGVYRYLPAEHSLSLVRKGDARPQMYDAALQEQAKEAPALVVISAVYQRTAVKYKERSQRYVHMEVGHAAQNLLLEAVALGLGTVVMGAFQPDPVKEVLGSPRGEEPLYLISIGKQK